MTDEYMLGNLYTDKNVFFYNGVFSNWYPAKFIDDFGIEYNCTEQHMMYHKALLFKDFDMACHIINADEPSDQKMFGRMIKNFDKDIWEKYCLNIVIAGNLLKFQQCPILRGALLYTGSRNFVEASPTDRIWGIGYSMSDIAYRILNNCDVDSPQQWGGTNLLGEALNTVKAKILSAYAFPDNKILTYDNDTNKRR